MPSPAVAAALARMDRKAGLEPRRPPVDPGEVYGVEQLVRDITDDRCPVHGCEEPTSSRALMCVGHWRCAPADVRREVMEAVHRVSRIATEYDRVSGSSGTIDHVSPSRREQRVAEDWLEAEQAMRDAQLRAVIIASERAGARPS